MKKKPKYITKEPEQLTCPFCGKRVSIENTTLPKMIDNLTKINQYHYYYDSIVKAKNGSFMDWACNRCEKKHIIFPDYSKQNYGYGGPIIIYCDKNLICSTCKEEFIFKAKDQKFWYEDLRFNYSSYAKDCFNCRKKVRDIKDLHKTLGDLLNMENKTIKILDQISDTYKKLGLEEKAKLYAAQAKNKKK